MGTLGVGACGASHDAKGASAGTRQPCKYQVYAEFQSHEPEFDYLKSLEIEEKINQVAFCRPVNGAIFLLSTNGALVFVVVRCSTYLFVASPASRAALHRVALFRARRIASHRAVSVRCERGLRPSLAPLASLCRARSGPHPLPSCASAPVWWRGAKYDDCWPDLPVLFRAPPFLHPPHRRTLGYLIQPRARVRVRTELAGGGYRVA